MSFYQAITNNETGNFDSFTLSEGAVADYFLRCIDTDGNAAWSDLSAFGVSSLQGTANQCLVNGTSGSPQVGDLILTLPQNIATTSNVQFADVKSTTFTIGSTSLNSTNWGYLNAINQNLGTSNSPSFAGLTAVTNLSLLGYAITPTNCSYLSTMNQSINTTSSPSFVNVTASLTGHASSDLALTGGTMAGTILMNSNNITGANLVAASIVTASTSANLGALTTSSITNNGTLNMTSHAITGVTSLTASTLQLTSGATNGYVLSSDASGNASWTAPSGLSGIVLSATGTANQCLVNGTSGSAQSGAITLSTPQDINTTSSPTFVSANLTASGAAPAIKANYASATGDNYVTQITLAGVDRYRWLITGSEAKGSDTGSWLVLRSFSNAGVALTDFLTFKRSTGVSPSILSGSSIDMNTFNISNATAISATTFTGALTGAASLNLLLTGGTMSGSIAMGGFNISGGGTITATTLAGTLSTAAQTNITSLGTLTSLTLGGTLAMGVNNITSSGNVGGTLSTAAQPNITSVGTLTSLTSSGNIVTSGKMRIGDTSAPTYRIEARGDANSSYVNTQFASINTGGTTRTWIAGTRNDGSFQIADETAAATRLTISTSNIVTVTGQLLLNTLTDNTNGNLTSGAYTPTITNVSNVTVANSTAASHFYQRIGDRVHIDGYCTIGASGSATTFTFTITTPFTAGNFSGTADAIGSGVVYEIGSATNRSTCNVGSVNGTQTLNISVTTFTTAPATTANNIYVGYSLTYRVR